MISSVNSLSSSSVTLLFEAGSAAGATQTASAADKLLGQVTGDTDDVFKAGTAIGKIIEIVAGMKASSSEGMFTMEGAERVDGQGGGYSLTKTGTGTVVSDAQFQQNGVDIARMQAAGSGSDAERAKAYLKALADGSIQRTDLSTQGVSAVMTKTNYYYADGGDKGEKVSDSVTGLSEFLKANTYEGDDGALRDKATGKYAGIAQNGTKFSYVVY